MPFFQKYCSLKNLYIDAKSFLPKPPRLAFAYIFFWQAQFFTEQESFREGQHGLSEKRINEHFKRSPFTGVAYMHDLVAHKIQ
jgi:hypothetical protein